MGALVRLRTQMRRTAIVTTSLLLLAAASAALQQPASSMPADLSTAELVARLGDLDFHVRDAATRRLIAMGPGVVDELRSALKSTSDPEIHHRVRYVLEHVVAPQRAVLLVRTDPDLDLAPGDVVTHVDGRRVERVAEFSRRLHESAGGATLRVRTPDGPREVGPVWLRQFPDPLNYVAPRGPVIANAVRLYATGYAEQAYAALQSLGSDIPPDELSLGLRARIAYTAGAAEAAKTLLKDASELVTPENSGDAWGSPSLLDLSGPGRAPAHLEWILWSRGDAPDIDRSNDPDLRLQRVLVPARRYLDTCAAAAEYWWTRYRQNAQDDDPHTAGGNMLAVTAWMLWEVDLQSECCRLIEPRSVILRRTTHGLRKWIRVQTDAWLKFFAGDERGALDSFSSDALNALRQSPRDPNWLIRNPRVAAMVALFLYRFPDEPQIDEFLDALLSGEHRGLAPFARWMLYGLDHRNHARIRADLHRILPELSDRQAPPVARAAGLLEYVQVQPDDDVMQAAQQRLQANSSADARNLALIDVLRRLVAGQLDEAAQALAACEDVAGARALAQTIDFRRRFSASGSANPGVGDPLMAVPLGMERAAWVVLARDGKLRTFDADRGESRILTPPSPTWFPGPLTWPWLGFDERSGRAWIYDRRRIVEVVRDDGLKLNIATDQIEPFDVLASPHFEAVHAMCEAFTGRETGDFLRADLRANQEFACDPDLPELAWARLTPDGGYTHIALRGGEHLLAAVDQATVWTSQTLADRLQLPRGPRFFPVITGEPERRIFLLSDQGLIELDPAAPETVRRIALPGPEPYPSLLPESVPYERRDPRWLYMARLPEDGGAVFRLTLETGVIEPTELINEVLSEGYYELISRDELRRQLDARLAARSLPPMAEIIADAEQRLVSGDVSEAPAP